jgi:CHAT domain-containing protein
VIKFSFLTDGKLGIRVLSGGTGELLCSKVVSSTGLGGSRGLSIQEVLKETTTTIFRTNHSMISGRGMRTQEDLIKAKVLSARERLSELMFEVALLRDKIDLMVPILDERVQNLLHEAQIGVEKSQQDKLGKDDSIDDLKERERHLWECWDKLNEVKIDLNDQLCQMLLKELYQALIAPVNAALEGAEELLIVPHKELFEVPWAALTDADGSYLIERYVIRTAPSLRVARQAADKMHQQGSKKIGGHALVVGNPWPNSCGRLEGAEIEAKTVARMLTEEGFEVRFHVTTGATKIRIRNDLKGVGWAHFSCHAHEDTQSLVLATPHVSRMGADEWALMKYLSIEDVETEVEMEFGSTVVLSTCVTVLGMGRSFLSAGASAVVVPLWTMDDQSTAVLMSIKYKYLAEGCTVPQALRLTMLRLARCNPADGLSEEWKQPYYWAGWVVVGATTRLPLP